MCRRGRQHPLGGFHFPLPLRNSSQTCCFISCALLIDATSTLLPQQRTRWARTASSILRRSRVAAAPSILPMPLPPPHQTKRLRKRSPPQQRRLLTQCVLLRKPEGQLHHTRGTRWLSVLPEQLRVLWLRSCCVRALQEHKGSEVRHFSTLQR